MTIFIRSLCVLIFVIVSYGCEKDQNKLKEGDLVWSVYLRVYINEENFSIGYSKSKFYSYITDEDFRSIEPREWKVSLIDKNNKILDSTNLVFKLDPLAVSALESSSKNVKDSSKKARRKSESAKVVFKVNEDAHFIEVYRKGKLVEQKRVSEI